MKYVIRNMAQQACQRGQTQEEFTNEIIAKYSDWDTSDIRWKSSQAYSLASYNKSISDAAQAKRDAEAKIIADKLAKEQREQSKKEWLARALDDAKAALDRNEDITQFIVDQRQKRDDYVATGAKDYPFGSDTEFDFEYNSVFLGEKKVRDDARHEEAEKDFIDGKTREEFEAEWRKEHPKTDMPKKKLDETWVEAVARVLAEEKERDKIEREAAAREFKPADGAREAVRNGLTRLQFIDGKTTVWKTNSAYKVLEQLEKDDLVKQAQIAWDYENDLYSKEQEQEGKDDGKIDPTPNDGKDDSPVDGGNKPTTPADGNPTPEGEGKDEEEEGGNGAVTAVIVILVLGIIGALGYIIFKMNKDDKEKDDKDKQDIYGSTSGMNSDGLMGLPDPDTQQYGGKYSGNVNDSTDSEHILPGVSDNMPKYGQFDM